MVDCGAPMVNQEAVTGEVDCDVLVIGSGAGGLAAATAAAHAGLRVIVAEKEALVGGTTARSGGYLWAPLSGPTLRAGITDNAENVRRYLDGRNWEPLRCRPRRSLYRRVP
jgi:succinate dehydrogenase/fumarate reductase flavoprotein subunit